MRVRIAVLALGIAALAAPPAWADPMHPSVDPEVYGPTAHQSPSDDDEVQPVSTDAGAIAEDLRLKGHCDQAVPMLRPLAARGLGHEIAQYDLGLCLYDLAKTSSDAAQVKALRTEGAAWVVRAANGGFAKAQETAVTIYLDGSGVDADPVEAKKWAILYHRNGMRLGIGLPDTPSALQQRVDAALDENKQDEAEKRADAWSPPVASADE